MHRITDLLIIGGGNMGGAIAVSCAQAGLGVTVVEPNSGTRGALVGRAPAAVRWAVVPDLGSAIAHSADSMHRGTLGVIVAVKPQVFPSIAQDLARALAPTSNVVLSIMAGVRTGAIQDALPGTRVLRAMPNLGAAIGLSMTALCAGTSATGEDLDAIQIVLGHFGVVERIDESLMDAFTSLAGSGPAFLFYLAEAMARGGSAVGFDSTQAKRIVGHTLVAAAHLLVDQEPKLDAATWRSRVTSKRGTTQAAMESLDAEDVMNAVARAVVAGRDRGRELGQSEAGRGP